MAVAISYITSEYAKIIRKELRVNSNPDDDYGKIISFETIDVEKSVYSKESVLEMLNDYFSQEVSDRILSFWREMLVYIPFGYSLSYPPPEPNVIISKY